MIAALVGVIATLASVVAYLFKRYERRDDKREKLMAEERKAIEAERATWALEREKLRGDFEEARAELAEQFAKDLRATYVAAQQREDAARVHFAEILERVEAKAQESAKSLVEMLKKFYDRFVGPRARY